MCRSRHRAFLSLVGRIAALAGLLCPRPTTAVAGPWSETSEAKVRLVSRFASAAPGGDAGLGLEYRLAPGWHVYWKNAGDAGYPPALDFEGGALVAPRLLYPVPGRFELPAGLVAFGYEHEVVYPIEARLASDATGPAAIAARLDYLVCAESCIPYQARLTLELPTSGANQTPVVDAEHAPLVDRARERLPTPAPAGVTARLVPAEGEAQTLELIFDVPGIRAGSPELFFEPHALVDLRRPERYHSAAGPGFRVPFRPFDETQPLPERLRFAWTASGFESDGAPVAWEGEIEVERAGSAAAPGLLWLAPLALLAIAALWFILRRGPNARAVPSRT